MCCIQPWQREQERQIAEMHWRDRNLLDLIFRFLGDEVLDCPEIQCRILVDSEPELHDELPPHDCALLEEVQA